MVIFICVVLCILIAVFGLAAGKPDTFRYERKIFIKAPPEKIYPYLSDVHKAGEWSPWDKKDPAMKKTFSGPASGVGAVQEWSGNNQVGAGKLEIIGATPEKITMRLTFLRPMKAINEATYEMVPQADGTDVVWTMYGRNPLMGKVFSLFVDCDKMVGKDFDAGLATLKSLCEKA